jgi:hypothetical protein
MILFDFHSKYMSSSHHLFSKYLFQVTQNMIPIFLERIVLEISLNIFNLMIVMFLTEFQKFHLIILSACIFFRYFSI